jgi:DNA-binding MarR family transcriptional regulator
VAVVSRELARTLPQDCPPASAGLLTLLRRHGEMRLSSLTELLGIDMSVTSRHVAHAADRGWIARRPDPNDGRSRLLHLTERGERQLEELSDRATASLSAHLADWPEEDVVSLSTLLGRLHSSYGRPGCAGPGLSSSPT